ncbi:unnamed protein product [Cuscuta europaea]|uniref:Carboxypeptidase n=1 Tax=Cuscuta europaea TaxID=41803 RepID=A0A9P1E1U7_CUSEU|nr:unnamed protein product [Cuscuta europaea]
MENFKVCASGVVFSLFLSYQFPDHFGVGAENVETFLNGSQPCGFVDVRPGAHMFWWLQKSPFRVNDPNKPWPIILWLHGGPGASGTGIGNFLEIGPFDANLRPRNSTWLKKADLLFVDSPVGVGYSYVDDIGLLTKNDSQAVSDLTTLLIEVFKSNVTNLENRTLYIIGESYGARLAVSLGLSVLNATQTKRLPLKLGGVTLGSSWISPEDHVLSWGPLLQTFSRIDEIGLEQVNIVAKQMTQNISEENFSGAADLYMPLQGVIRDYSNAVDTYNLLRDSMDSTVSTTAFNILNNTMNGVIKKILRLPTNISWVGTSLLVFRSMSTDFMKPRIDEVDQLLSIPVDVTIYNGQVDLVCGPTGTKAWIQKLKWEGLKPFLNTNRTALYCCGNSKTRGFLKSYRNFHFYTILGAGHFVPADQPDITLEMVGNITKSPSTSN